MRKYLPLVIVGIIASGVILYIFFRVQPSTPRINQSNTTPSSSPIQTTPSTTPATPVPGKRAPTSLSKKTTEIWFQPRPSDLRIKFGEPANDYYSLFAPNAAWQDVIPHIEVFGVSGNAVQTMTPEELTTVFSFLNSHHIALSVGGAIVPTKADCGFGEGYGGGTDPVKVELAIVKRAQAYGANISYINFDEPLWFGHENIGKKNLKTNTFIPGCHYTPTEVGKFSAAAFKAVQALIPNVQLVESETVQSSEYAVKINRDGTKYNSAEWLSTIQEYLQSFEASAGVPLYQLEADVKWDLNYKEELIPLTSYLRSHGTRLAIIYNSPGGAVTSVGDVAWINSAISHYQEVESTLGIIPDAANFASWNLNPNNFLPDTDPGAFTHLVQQYILWSQKQ